MYVSTYTYMYYACIYVRIHMEKIISLHNCVLVDSQPFLRVDASLPHLPVTPPLLSILGKKHN